MGWLQILGGDMERSSFYTVLGARVLMSAVFLLNGFGIIDQKIPAREMMEEGMPAALVPLLMMAGRSLEIIAGFALAFGIYPRVAAIGLFLFLVPATLVSHSFWLAAGTPTFQSQLINFFKNAGIWGGLLFIAASAGQPAILPRNPTMRRA
jgi:putative oxidoreductase